MYDFIPSPNFSNRAKSISLIVMHFTAGSNLNGAVAWFSNPKSKVSAHYIIGRDGRVVQMVKDDKKAWHAGRSSWKNVSNVNDYSIGVELVNLGMLKKEKDVFYCSIKNWTKEYDAEKFGEPVFKNKNYWAPYTEAQINSAIKLCKKLREKYPTIETIVGHEDIAPGRKYDPGPAFPMKRVISESEPFNLDLLYKETGEDNG